MGINSNKEFDNLEMNDPELEEMLYAKEVEIKSLEDLLPQRGTPVPALFNVFYKFIQNPSTVSVETFKKMVDTDDTIGSGVDFLTTLLAARLGTYQHENQEITEWVNTALKLQHGGFNNSLKEILSAVWTGFSVTEQVWANTPHGMIVEKLVTLPPATVLFEVNRTGDITADGILQYQRNYNPALLGAGTLYGTGFSYFTFPYDGRPDPFAKFGDLPYPIRVGNTFSYLSIRIPKDKCIHYAHHGPGSFGNPYGRSLLRRAYNFWVLKNALLRMLAIAMDRKGTPILVVYTDSNQTVLKQDAVNQGINQRGQLQGERLDVAVKNAFNNIHNDSVIVLPGKKDQMITVDPVTIQSNAQDFIAAIDRCDRGIMRALLIPSLMFLNGDGSGSFALGQEHAKTFEKILDGMLVGVKQVLIDQHISRMIKLNFPKEIWEKEGFGDFSKKDFTIDEIQNQLSAIETAVNIGAADMTDLADMNKVREMIGLMEKTETIDKGLGDELTPDETNPLEEEVQDEQEV